MDGEKNSSNKLLLINIMFKTKKKKLHLIGSSETNNFNKMLYLNRKIFKLKCGWGGVGQEEIIT